MIARATYLSRLTQSVRRSPVTALLGPRQCGKTTLARQFGDSRHAAYFDLESAAARHRLQNPELALGALRGLIVLDEIQSMPELFSVLRVLVDRPRNTSRFLILGNASPDLVKGVSESLAGRVEFVELSGFHLNETGPEALDRLWLRGGFPRSLLARNEVDSNAWREGFIQTFLQRDIPQLGISVAAPTLRRFWTMLAHFHGQIWNSSEFGRSMSVTDKTVRSWLDILTGTFMVRPLQPWYENLKKRQVKAPKIYFRDSGLLHTLLNLPDLHTLQGHPRVGASWEGFALEETLSTLRPPESYFWATHGGAELDLMFVDQGKRYGVEFKFSESPIVTPSMRTAISDLELKHLWIVHPGSDSFPIDRHISACPLRQIGKLKLRQRSLTSK
jgi:predicted AAA+ superfamily ATPase